MTQVAGRRPRVLLVQGVLDRGGPCQTRAVLAEHLDQDRHEVEVCCLYHAEGPFHERVCRSGIKVSVLGMPLLRMRWSLWRPEMIARLARFIARGSYDIVQTLTYMDGVLGRLAARLAGVPVRIAEVRGEYPVSARYWATVPLDFLLARDTQALITNSEAVARQLRRFLRLESSHCFPINNPVNPARLTPSCTRAEAREMLGLPPRTIAIGIVANLAPEKGHVHALRAFAKLQPGRYGCRLYLIGRGPQELPLRRLAHSLGVSDRVTHLGWRDDVADLLAAFDIFALPSLTEGWGNAAAEACWSGLPVVASAVGGLPEVLGDGTGILVPPRDVPALTAALQRLMQNEDERQQLGRKAQDRARRLFCPTRFARRYQDVWDELLARRPKWS